MKKFILAISPDGERHELDEEGIIDLANGYMKDSHRETYTIRYPMTAVQYLRDEGWTVTLKDKP